MRIWCPAIINGVITSWKEFYNWSVWIMKTLLNLHVCRFGTGLPMTKKQLHTEVQLLAKNTRPGWRTFCLTPSILWKSACNSAGCGTLLSDMIETFTKKARESQYLHYMLAKFPIDWMIQLQVRKIYYLAIWAIFGFQF